MIRKMIPMIPAVLAATFAAQTMAAVSAEEAKQLGGSVLTAIGAEKAGNKEGTIPAYTGEGVKAPANWDPKDPTRRPDIYANEKPLFSITAQNAAQYADKLDGMTEMFKRFPKFRMDIYPSHRTGLFPKWVLENTAKNATACSGGKDDLKLEGCYGGYPFPIPKSGAQVMWNKLTAFMPPATTGKSMSYVVNTNGNTVVVAGNDFWEQSDYYDPAAKTPAKPNTLFWVFRMDSIAPTRKVGEKLVLLDPVDILGVGRRAYQYLPGQRRVKLAPDLAYDTPAPSAGGVATMDDAKVFLGAIDRYNWKLVGKKEKYIMYNNFKLTDHGTCNNAVLHTPYFANPDCVRWELHRVWEVQGSLKPGFRHIYPKRTFYWDEDGYGAGMAENYDGAGKLYRVITAISYPFWAEEGGGQAAESTFNYDLQTGNWSSQGATGDAGQGLFVSLRKNELFFSPESLAGGGIR